MDCTQWYELIHHLATPAIAGQCQTEQPRGAEGDLLRCRGQLKWRGLTKRFGNWHTIYTRMNRWAKKGKLDWMFAELRCLGIIRVTVEMLSLYSTSVKMHLDGHGAQENASSRSGIPGASGPPRFI